MANLEDTVRSVVQDFIANEVLFTALDVSNSVKKTMPQARHREIRDVVRSLFSTDIETADWARTPITVTLADGTTAEALLYHPLTYSWDLDTKYSTQQRAQTSARPQVTFTANDSGFTVTGPGPITVADPSVTVAHTAPAPVPFTTARTQWDSLFKSQPSLFPTK